MALKGSHLSKELRKRIAKTLQGRKLSEKHKDAIRRGCKGINSEIRKGKSWEQIFGLRTANRMKKEVSKRFSGKKPNDHLQKISKSLKGRIFTEEHKSKLKIARHTPN